MEDCELADFVAGVFVQAVVAMAGRSRSRSPRQQAAVDSFLAYRRGGLHQRRIQAAHAAAAQAQAQAQAAASSRSSLAHELLLQWSLGGLSAISVQSLASKAFSDGLVHPDIARLAALGNSGQAPQNCQRDLLRWLGKHMGALPPPVQMKLPLKTSPEEESVQVVELPLLPLHRMMAYMWEHWQSEFQLRLVGEDGAVEAFWNNISPQDPRWATWHPFLQKRAGYKQKCLPLALHGDGVPVFRKKSLNVVSVNSLLGTGSSLDTKLLLASYWDALRNRSPALPQEDTEQVLWDYIVWDLKAVWEGVHPASDPHGNPWPVGSQEAQFALQPLCGGFLGIPWLFRADLDYVAKVLGLGHWGREHPCIFCKAGRTQCLFTDFRPEAEWRRAVWGGQEWRDAHPDCHKLLRFLGCSIHTVHCDVLHTVSLGVTYHVVANVLYLLIWEGQWPSRTPLKERLRAVWTEIKEFYSLARAPVRLTKLLFSMFLPDIQAPHQNYPLLQGVKAKEAEWLARAAHWVWSQRSDHSKPAHQHITCALGYLIEFYDICGAPGLFLSAETAATATQCCDNLPLHYSWLSRDALGKLQKIWNIAPKLHYMVHLGQRRQFLHPRCGWTYSDEDFVGRIARLARASTGGVAIDRLQRTIAAKYSNALYLRWSARLPTGGGHWAS